MNSEVFGELVPLAMIIALSPLTIIPIVLVLHRPNPRPAAVAYLAGWIVGLTALTTLFTSIANVLPHSADGPPPWASWTRIVLGSALIAFGLFRWFTRHGKPHELPGMRQLAKSGPAGLFGIAALMTVANPKVFFLCAAAGVVISASDLGAQTVPAVAAFIAAAASTVLLPVVGYLLSGGRLDRPLERLGGWLQQHSAALVAITLIVIGVLVLHKGLAHL